LSSFERGLRRRAERVRAEREKRRARQARIEGRELTYWNGEPASCRKVRVLVGSDSARSEWLSNRFAGAVRDAVEVSYAGSTFYLDDEGFERTDDELERLEAAAQNLAAGTPDVTLAQARGHYRVSERVIGFPGWGWAKVTAGRGSPAVGHLTLIAERVVAERD
jgi:hypothetical protein